MTDLVDDLTTQLPIGPFFRFPDEATGMAALTKAGLRFIDEDGNQRFITTSHNHALDVIGIIQRGGEWDEEGNVVVPPVSVAGWHINYQGELPDGWEQYAVQPLQPVRIWA